MPRITSGQIRAARAFLGISQEDVAEKAGVSIAALQRMEAGNGPILGTVDNVSAVLRVFDDAGVIFTATGGIEVENL
jgi:transcriptional regulator with XRE-family HTH domain